MLSGLIGLSQLLIFMLLRLVLVAIMTVFGGRCLCRGGFFGFVHDIVASAGEMLTAGNC